MRPPRIGLLVACALVLVACFAPSAGAAAARHHCTITGTSGDDVLHGTAKDDVICGRGGDDVIFGGKGDDVLIGGQGRDTLYGGAGDDTLDADSHDWGADGGAGKDTGDAPPTLTPIDCPKSPSCFFLSEHRVAGPPSCPAFTSSSQGTCVGFTFASLPPRGDEWYFPQATFPASRVQLEWKDRADGSARDIRVQNFHDNVPFGEIVGTSPLPTRTSGSVPMRVSSARTQSWGDATWCSGSGPYVAQPHGPMAVAVIGGGDILVKGFLDRC